jgi:transcriptional regulator GlxA family with amidase domain
VAIVIYDGINSIDLAGPLEVFHTADLLLGRGRYDLRTIGPTAQVATSSGLRLHTDTTLAERT